MSEKNEVSARNETPAMYKSGGFGAVGSYFFTIFYTGFVQGNFLRGRPGVIACSIAAQDAYNLAAMKYCISVQKK